MSYLLICMLPLFCAKLANTIFVDLTSYKNLMISKSKILGVMEEPEESGSMEPFQTDTHEITFDHVVLRMSPESRAETGHLYGARPEAHRHRGDSGSGKSTILNLIAKYYEPSGGAISIGGSPRAVWRQSGCWSRSPWWIRMCSSLMTPSVTISATHALKPLMGNRGGLPGGQLRRLYPQHGEGL